MIRPSVITICRRRHHLPTWVALAALSACSTAPAVRPALADRSPAVAVAAAAPPAAPPAAPVLAPTVAPAAVGAAKTEQGFAIWVRDFKASARAAGISDAVLNDAFAQVRLLSRVIDSDRSQPEFVRTVWAYLDGAVSQQRIVRGQDKLRQWQQAAAASEASYGVPATIIAAIWGIESNYGSNVGDIPVIDALASLGYEGRREAWARGQLLAALRILQNRDIEPARMIGSWAGAMGQTQFLPSNFLAYAVDADGDGRRDLWGSVPDVLASTANYLARSGWQPGQPWGVEVSLPAGFDFARADAELQQSSALWASQGVAPIDGTALPAIADASILLPAGARGPAFLIGPNFRTILRYNNSTSYALAVGLLAQQIGGGAGVLTAWPRELQALTRSQLQALQTSLNQRGFDSGTPDGVFGPATRRGIRAYQRSVGLAADGYPTLVLLQQLQVQ